MVAALRWARLFTSISAKPIPLLQIECEDVIRIVAELEPAHALKVLENALFTILLAKNGRDHKARWRDLREFHRGMRKLFLASQRLLHPFPSN